MTRKELEEFNAARRIEQICILTEDIDKTVKAWVDILRVGPWRISTFSDETMRNFKVGGALVEEPFELQVAISHIGDLEIEIIQHVSGPAIYKEFIKRKGTGLHHIKEKLPEDGLGKELERYAGLGIEVLQTGWYAQDVHYYINTEPATNIIWELGNCPVIDVPESMYRMYPED